MNEGTGMKDDAGLDAQSDAGLDAQSAAVIIREAREHAQRELTINRRAIFAAWALVYLLGYGAVWLSVRGQRPYHAPGLPFLLIAVLPRPRSRM